MSKIHPARVELVFRPIQNWNGPDRCVDKNDRFERTGTQTQIDLRCELAIIGVGQAIIQADVSDDDIRRDGMFRARATFRTSRIVVGFTHPKQGPVAFPCWTYRDAWANLRAIVMTLEALRTVERHGVTRNAQQYTGWKALPEGDGAAPFAVGEFSSPLAAAEYIVKIAGIGDCHISPTAMVRSAEPLRLAYRAACRRSHPDQGGSEEVMRRVNLARDFIERSQK